MSVFSFMSRSVHLKIVEAGDRKCFRRREGSFGCRRLVKDRNFPILRSNPSPPPPPVDGRKRAMNVPPAPASAFLFH